MGQIPQNKGAERRFHAMDIELRYVSGPRDAINDSLRVPAITWVISPPALWEKAQPTSDHFSSASDGAGSSEG